LVDAFPNILVTDLRAVHVQRCLHERNGACAKSGNGFRAYGDQATPLPKTIRAPAHFADAILPALAAGSGTEAAEQP
jgi:hypothetical protein